MVPSAVALPSYWQLLGLILPVFGLIGLGVLLRGLNWLTAEADASLLKLVVNCLYASLIFENVYVNDALRSPSNLAFAPTMGFAIMAATIWVALGVGKIIGLERGQGLRTFAFGSGINNYGYIPIPLLAALFGENSLGVLLVHNVGCEVAVWSVGILVLAGLSLREGWRKLFNAPLIALILGLGCNFTGLGAALPVVATSVIHQCAVCAIPLGLILIGATLEPYVQRPAELFEPKVSLVSILLRLGVFPLGMLAVARVLPCSIDLKRVLIVQAAMPAGIMPIVISKHYGGHPLTAVRVVIGTTVLGIFSIPLWLRLGMAWVL